MDTRDRFWIFTATAVAIASIGLSAFIVAFAPEDPYQPASRTALRSDHPLQVRESAAANERRANGNVREAGAAAEDLWDAGNHHRLGYAAGGAAAGIALMFAVMGLLDRGAATRALEDERPAMSSCKGADAVGAPSCTRDADDTEVSASIAMFALGFGAFVDRDDPQPMARYSHAATGDGAARLDEQAMAFHRLAAGYGAAAIGSHCSENRRRADRRNPCAARTSPTVERRRAPRRISDVNSESRRNTVVRRGRSLAATRQEAIY